MPAYYLFCEACGDDRHVIRKNAKAADNVTCQTCGFGPMIRAVRAPTSRVVETLDSGIMSRRVERPADAERLYRERAEKDNKDKGY